MIRFSTTCLIHAPMEKVFSYVADPKRIPEWRRDVRKVSEVRGPVQTGITYFEEMGGKQVMMKIVEFVHEKKLVVEAQGGTSLLPTLSFIFSSERLSTRIYLSAAIRTQGLYQLFGFMMSSGLKQKWDGYFQNLQRILGDQSTLAVKAPTITRRGN